MHTLPLLSVVSLFACSTASNEPSPPSAPTAPPAPVAAPGPPVNVDLIHSDVDAKASFVVGDVSYRVDGAQLTPKFGGNRYSLRFAPEGKQYLIVNYAVRNNEAEAQTYDGSIVVKNANETLKPSAELMAAVQAGGLHAKLPDPLPSATWQTGTVGFVLPTTLQSPTIVFTQGDSETSFAIQRGT